LLSFFQNRKDTVFLLSSIEINAFYCLINKDIMSKNKSKTVISEEEKAENPIFKAIYNRIRNINKKIQAIQALEANDPKHLKN